MNGPRRRRCLRCATNLFDAARHSLIMRSARQWTALALVLGLRCVPAAPAAEFTLTPDESQPRGRSPGGGPRQPRCQPAPRHGARRGAHRGAARRGIPDDDPLRGRAPVRAPPAEVPGARPGARRELAAGRTRDRLRLVCAAGQLGIPRRAGHRPQHRLPPGERRLQGERGHLGARAHRGRRHHAAAVPRLHRSARLRAQLAGAFHLPARTAADADRAAATL